MGNSQIQSHGVKLPRKVNVVLDSVVHRLTASLFEGPRTQVPLQVQESCDGNPLILCFSEDSTFLLEKAPSGNVKQ